MCSMGTQCLCKEKGDVVTMAMKMSFLKAKFGVDFKVPNTFDKVLSDTFGNGGLNLAVFCSVQFRDNLENVQKMLEDKGFTTQTSKPFRTSIEGQMLGCDSYADTLNMDMEGIDGFIYIGDGYFHPNALLLAQEFEDDIKPVILMNVVQQITEVIDKKHIEKYLMRKKGNMMKFHMSEVIGVFVTTKWGQEYKDSALKLEDMWPEKQFYYFIGDNFMDQEMENFPYVDVWVNTACPRIGQDDIVRHNKPVVNIKDIFKMNS